MKKLVLSMAVLFSAMMVMAQSFGKASIAIVPKADIVAFSNAEKLNAASFSEKVRTLSKQIEQEEWFKKQVAEADDDFNLEKIKVAAEKLLATIGFNKDENFIKTCVFSLALNDFRAQGAEPDYSKLDMAFAAELVKPIAISQDAFASAMTEFLSSFGEDFKDEISLKPGRYGAIPTVTIELKDEDIPVSFKKITIAFLNPQFVLIAPEASAKAALDRAQKGSYVAADKFFTSIKDDSFVAIKSFSELSALLNEAVGDNPAFAPLASANGFALVANANEKMTISLKVYLPTADAATAIKTQIWDAQVVMMLEMFKPSINEAFNGNLPLLSTIKGTAKGNTFSISLDLSIEDIKAFYGKLKENAEAEKADDDDED